MEQNSAEKNRMKEHLKSILDAAWRYFDKEIPYIFFPSYTATVYPDRVQGIESFSRILWGASFADDSVLSIEKKHQLMNAIAIGTNRTSPHYWGDLTDYSQIAVEMTPIAFFVYLNKDLFCSLEEEDRNNVSKWLYEINSVKLYDNNWQCFVVLVNLFLRLLGCKYSDDRKKEALKKIEGMYIEDGWYSDGKTEQLDYYISFGIHYYMLIYHYFSPKKEETQKYLDRAVKFSETFIYWFADNGAGLPFGRSLTYKFAQAAFWAALSMNDTSTELKQIAKGILFRNLDWWFEREIFDRDGLLVLGYAYPNQQMIENYNASGSSYWSLKSFLFLLIPSDDVFWNLPLSHMPCLSYRKMICPAKMVVCRDKGHSYAFINGQKASFHFGHTECKYEKFIYNTKSGVCISRSCKGLELLAPDSTIAISLNGEDYVLRSNYEVIRSDENCLVSKWVPEKKIQITSFVIPNAPAHIRVHYIDTAEQIVFIDGGFSLPKDHLEVLFPKCYVYAKESNMLSAAGSLTGEGKPLCIEATPNSSLMFKRCVIPAVKYIFHPGKYKVTDWFYFGEENTETINKTLKYKSEENLIIYGDDKVDISINNLNDYMKPNRRISILKNIKKWFK